MKIFKLLFSTLAVGLLTGCSDSDEPAVIDSSACEPMKLVVALTGEDGRDLLADGYESTPYGQCISAEYGNRSYEPVESTFPGLGVEQGFCDPMAETPSPMPERWKPATPFTGLTREAVGDGHRLVFGEFDTTSDWVRRIRLFYAAIQKADIEIHNHVVTEKGVARSRQTVYVDGKEVAPDCITLTLSKELQQQNIFSALPGLQPVPVIIDLVDADGNSVITPRAPGAVSYWDVPVRMSIDNAEYALDWSSTAGPRVYQRTFDWPRYSMVIDDDFAYLRPEINGGATVTEPRLSERLLKNYLNESDSRLYFITMGHVWHGVHELTVTVGEGDDAVTRHCTLTVSPDLPGGYAVTVDGKAIRGNIIKIGV